MFFKKLERQTHNEDVMVVCEQVVSGALFKRRVIVRHMQYTTTTYHTQTTAPLHRKAYYFSFCLVLQVKDL